MYKVAIGLVVVVAAGLFILCGWADMQTKRECRAACNGRVVLTCDYEHQVVVCVTGSEIVHFNSEKE